MSRLIGCARCLKSPVRATTPSDLGAARQMSSGFGYRRNTDPPPTGTNPAGSQGNRVGQGHRGNWVNSAAGANMQ
jgi:hypothetical protein